MRLALVLLVVLFAVVCVRGIAAPWHWGHNGYNGAAFSQAARNSLRFGIVGQAPYYFGAEPPLAREIYTHHPLALHGHVVANFALLGEHEWAARLVPFAYSVAILILFMLAVRRYWGDGTALLAGAAYALTPLNLIFANMVDHEQGGIFWCLTVIYVYLRWLDTGESRYALLCASALTVALQFDWPAYYIAFAVAVHCIAMGMRGQAPGRWRGFVVLFSLLTLANSAAFLAWVQATKSGLGDMVDAFMWRRRVLPLGAYVGLLARRFLSLYGPVLLAAAAVGVVASWRSTKQHGLQARAILPLAFSFAGLVHVIAFPNAARLHSYWIYYWSPAIALSAAVGLESLIAGVRARTSGRPIGALVVVAFFLAQGVYAGRTWLQQLDHGHAADCSPCNFQRHERLWFQALAERSRSETPVRYAIHKSVHEPRIELHYYLDAPHRRVQRLNGRKDEILLVDASNLSAIERGTLLGIRSIRSSTIWGGRFYAIDLRSVEVTETWFEAFPDRRGALNWWLTTQTSDAPLRWERVP